MLAWLDSHDLTGWADFPDYDWYITGVEYIDEPGTYNHSPYGKDPILNGLGSE